MKRVVVVEDNRDMATLIELALAAEPELQVVGVAADAERAIEFARTEPPDLFVLDNALDGDVDGIAVAPRLKEAAPTARIILFTAHENVRGLAAGEPAIDAFLIKTDMRRLLPLARRLVGIDTVAS